MNEAGLVHGRYVPDTRSYSRQLIPSQEIKNVLAVKRPELKVKRIMFSGQMLTGTCVNSSVPACADSCADDNTLSFYDIHKECTVQVMTEPVAEAGCLRHPVASSVVSLDCTEAKALQPVGLHRQLTEEELRYGDVVVVQLIQARDLVAADYWSGKSDPYCILSVCLRCRPTTTL